MRVYCQFPLAFVVEERDAILAALKNTPQETAEIRGVGNDIMELKRSWQPGKELEIQS